MDAFGKRVTVVVDRPLGFHHPDYPDLVYPINYGYISDVLASDGEEQDVYILGIDKPISTFEGRVIAVIHRQNDIEDKLVVAPCGMKFSREEIIEQTAFQEKYFEIQVEMLY